MGTLGPMTDLGDSVPAYRTIRMTALDQPVAAVADVEAWEAREKYPDLLSAGGPVFGVARERERGGWELLDSVSGDTPQDGRDAMGSQFRRLLQRAEQDGDPAAQEACARAVELMDWEPLDELTVLGVRHRVVRAEVFVRSGPDGPEPPRPSDPDPAPPGESHSARCPTEGFVIDPLTATGMSEGILKVELLSLVRKAGTVPDDVREDSRRAAETHPGGVLLPATFMTAEHVRGRWRPESGGACVTPQAARDGLAMKLRVMIPWELGPDPALHAPYMAAADRFDARRTDELTVEGRRFRIVRVERLVRVGPEGPEGPRPSDPDPYPPVMVYDQQLREQGVLTDEDEQRPVVLSPETQRLADLVHAEEDRRRALRRRP
ncbi:hypothetical protein GCM10014713_23590 [Streptomyces purpureus]|uniref:PE-PGRS family protein n=2 Tax=Streptomyces purpureus TaxID=1951 RepID=A0A918H1G4_9ACTN|nr:hypothetical protein GCM10014713_23590 [Streptomyces purpureus]